MIFFFFRFLDSYGVTTNEEKKKKQNEQTKYTVDAC